MCVWVCVSARDSIDIDWKRAMKAMCQNVSTGAENGLICAGGVVYRADAPCGSLDEWEPKTLVSLVEGESPGKLSG